MKTKILIILLLFSQIVFAQNKMKVIEKKKMDDVLINKNMNAYSVNKYHDVNKDGKIRKSEIAHNVQKHYKKGILFKG